MCLSSPLFISACWLLHGCPDEKQCKTALLSFQETKAGGVGLGVDLLRTSGSHFRSNFKAHADFSLSDLSWYIEISETLKLAWR